MGTIKGFKGFEEKGEIKSCEKGFLFCENPTDVFSYYPPTDDEGNLNRFFEIEGTGEIDKDSEDSKAVCSKINISAEIGIKDLIKAWVKFILDKVNWNDSKESNTEDWSAATNTGDQSAATNTGNWSVAINNGELSAATVEGKDCISIVTGYDSKAKGSLGCWIVLTERGEWDEKDCPILSIQAFKVDGKSIKDNTFYKLVDGKPVEVE